MAVSGMLIVSILSPLAAFASQSSRQKNKNLWRNGAIGGGAVALYGLTHHNTGATLLGAGAAAYSASRYEKDRKSPAAAARARARYDHHHHRR